MAGEAFAAAPLGAAAAPYGPQTTAPVVSLTTGRGVVGEAASGGEAHHPAAHVGHSAKKAAPRFNLGDGSLDEIFCVRFSPDDLYLAAACGSGAIHIFNTLTGKKAFVLGEVSEGGDRLPTTQLRWRPQQAASKTRNVLVSVGADGRITHWHASSGKCLHEIREADNQLFCLDYALDGSQFATAGKQREVRVYDEATKKLAQTLKGGDSLNTPGHSNRVFALKYHPRDKNIVVTGGWDNTVQIWDLRRGHAVRAILGPHISGDAVDVSSDGETLLTGSWRIDRQLQLWDLRSERLLETLPWRTAAAGMSFRQPCMLYTAQFSKHDGSSLIIAGGSGSNEAKLFDRQAGGAVFGTVAAMSRACYTADFSHSGSMVAVAGGDGTVRVLDIFAT